MKDLPDLLHRLICTEYSENGRSHMPGQMASFFSNKVDERENLVYVYRRRLILRKVHFVFWRCMIQSGVLY